MPMSAVQNFGMDSYASPCLLSEEGCLPGGEGGGGVRVAIAWQHFLLKVLFNERQRSEKGRS